jgi:hypothetical protein
MVELATDVHRAAAGPTRIVAKIGSETLVQMSVQLIGIPGDVRFIVRRLLKTNAVHCHETHRAGQSDSPLSIHAVVNAVVAWLWTTAEPASRDTSMWDERSPASSSGRIAT